METVWLVDSCLPPDGIPQVAEPPLRYLPSFIGGAWRGIGAERERSWIWSSGWNSQKLNSVDIPNPGCKTSISRVDVSCIVRYTRIFIPLTLHLANSNHIPSFLFAKIRSNVVIYIYIKLKRLNIPLYTTRRGIFYSRIITNLPERERERKRLATRKINKSGKRV